MPLTKEQAIKALDWLEADAYEKHIAPAGAFAVLRRFLNQSVAQPQVRMLTEDEERAEHDAAGRGYMSVRTIVFSEALQRKFAEVNGLTIKEQP